MTTLLWLSALWLGENLTFELVLKNVYILMIWPALFLLADDFDYLPVIFSAYILFLVSIVAESFNFQTLPTRVNVSYMWFSISFVFVLTLNHALNKNRPWTHFSVSAGCQLLFILIPLFYLGYALLFDSSVGSDTLYALFQTNSNEARAFVADYFSLKPFALIVLVGMSVALPAFSLLRKNNRHIKVRLTLAGLLIFTGLAFMSRDDLRMFNHTKNAAINYFSELNQFKRMQQQVALSTQDYKAHKAEKGEQYVVIIGESLNKNHMGIYGYHRNTTPRLKHLRDQGELLIFKQAYASHTHTMPVLSQALTEANHKNRKKYFESASIVNLMNQANFQSHWITNQQLFGQWDNLVSIIAHQSDNLVALNKALDSQTTTQYFDEVAIEPLSTIIKEDLSRNRVVFVHLMGNHGRYCSRYPPSFGAFHDKLTHGEFGQIANSGNDEIINCYDNSVLYNDYVVSELIERIKGLGSVSALLYFSDHADDVFNNLGHNSSNFTYEMTHIPLVVWLSDRYKERYSQRSSFLSSHMESLFPSDYMFDTLLGLTGVESTVESKANDLTSAEYAISPERAVFFDGTKRYSDKGNAQFHQHNNILKLKKSSSILRFIPHRVNTLGKLNQILAEGYRGFEVDVFFQDDERGGYFEIGHDPGNMTRVHLFDFLQICQGNPLGKIWLDIKNLNQHNQPAVLERLNLLHEAYGLKDIALVESPIEGNNLKLITQAGWNTSYYLPVHKIKDLLAAQKLSELSDLTEKIIVNMERNSVTSISFEHSVYFFVKKRLE